MAQLLYTLGDHLRQGFGTARAISEHAEQAHLVTVLCFGYQKQIKSFVGSTLLSYHRIITFIVCPFYIHGLEETVLHYLTFGGHQLKYGYKLQ